MAKAKKPANKSKKKPIEQYDHKGKKPVYNPLVGLVMAATDQESGKKTYAYDPRLDPTIGLGRKGRADVFRKHLQSRFTSTVKRNQDRFPADFMFELSKEEYDAFKEPNWHLEERTAFQVLALRIYRTRRCDAFECVA